MLTKSSEYISVSLSENILKIAQVKSGTPSKVNQVIAQDVSNIDPAELPQTIKAALKKFKFSSLETVCVIPSSMVTTKNIEIPSTNPEEIKSIVDLQAGRHTPFSREEILIGYVNIGVYNNNYSRVLLVIAKREDVNKQIELLSSAGLKVRRVLFAQEGVAAFYAQPSGIASGATPTGIIDVGEKTTEMILVSKGLPITTRHIPIGKAQLAADGTECDKLVEELSKTIESYTNDDIDRPPEKYVLTTDDEHIQNLKSALESKLSWQVEVASYIDGIKASQSTLKRIATDFVNNSFLNVIASVASSAQAQVDLIPEEVKFQESLEAQSKEVFRTAILGLIFVILVGSVLGVKVYFHNHYLNRLVTEYQGNREQVKELEANSKRTKIIQGYLNSRMISLDLINELYQSIPNEIYLTNIVMDEQGGINVQGISDVASLVFNLGSTLKDSELFKSVEIKSTTAKKDRGKDVSAFEISLRLASAADPIVEDSEEAAQEQQEQ